MKTSDFDYYLPQELIAQNPLEKRDECRMLHLKKDEGKFFDKYFYDVDGVEIMTDDERSEYLSEAEYSIEKAAQFEYFAQHIGAIQTAIDLVAVAHIYGRDNYLNEENYIV